MSSDTVADTPWQAGRFDERVADKKVLFGHMYEDTAIEQPPGRYDLNRRYREAQRTGAGDDQHGDRVCNGL